MGLFWSSTGKANSLKNMEPMSGIEPLTYALRMGKKKVREMTDKYVISFWVVDSDTVEKSNAIHSVLTEPFSPQP
jgi:hypothetical protein